MDVRDLTDGPYTVVSGKAVTQPKDFVAWIEHLASSATRALLFQREGFAPPGGWQVVDSCASLRVDGEPDRVAFLLMRARLD